LNNFPFSKGVNYLLTSGEREGGREREKEEGGGRERTEQKKSLKFNHIDFL
jgi:hypothetical protein